MPLPAAPCCKGEWHSCGYREKEGHVAGEWGGHSLVETGRQGEGRRSGLPWRTGRVGQRRGRATTLTLLKSTVDRDLLSAIRPSPWAEQWGPETGCRVPPCRRLTHSVVTGYPCSESPLAGAAPAATRRPPCHRDDVLLPVPRGMLHGPRRMKPCVVRPVRLAYQPPASSTFLSEQTSH
jgi:hypothetical protein